MKAVLRNTVFNAISLFILTQILSGVKVTGGIKTLLISGLLLSILLKVLKPILNLFSLPLNVITLGLFTFITNAVLLYVLTLIVPQVQISEFTFNGFSFAGFVAPVMHFNIFWAFVISAAVLSVIINFFDWILKR